MVNKVDHFSTLAKDCTYSFIYQYRRCWVQVKIGHRNHSSQSLFQIYQIDIELYWRSAT